MSEYETIFDPKQTLAKLTLDPAQTISAKISMEAAETEDAFIFETIGPFIRDHSHMEISKQELLEAITLVRLRREAMNKYGTCINYIYDIPTASAEVAKLHDAYIRGVQDGKDSMYETMMSKFKELEED